MKAVKVWIASLPVAAAIALAPAISWAQPLEAQEIQDALAAPLVQASFVACAEGQVSPGTIKLVVAATGDGKLGITATVPTIDKGLLACLRAVAGTIELRATGEDAMMVVSMTLGAGAIAAPVPPSGVAPQQGAATQPVQPQPATPAPQYATQYAPGPPVYAKPAPAYSSDVLKTRSKGYALTIPGIVLAGVGGLAMLVPFMAWVIDSAGCDPTWDGESWRYDGLLFSVALTGLVGYGAGVGLIAAGGLNRGKSGAVIRGLVAEGPQADLFGRGAAMSSAGSALVVGGGVAVVIPLIYGIAMATACSDGGGGDCFEFSPQLLGVALAGIAGVSAGAARLASGSKKKAAAMAASQALASESPSVVVSPLAGKGTVGLALSARF